MAGSLDGVDFINEWRRQKPEQRVIFITGYTAEEKLSQALKAEGCFYLPKPFHLDELFRTIDHALGEKEKTAF
jgi:DNA-binding NtrC family response regulator